MKRAITFFLFFFAGIILLQAQPKLLSESLTLPVFGKLGYPNIEIYDQEDEYTGLFKGPVSSAKYADKEGNNSAIIRFTQNSTHVTQSNFKIDKSYDLQTFFNCKENVVGLYSKYDKKEDLYAIYKDLLPRSGRKHTSNPKLIANFSLAGRDGKFTYFASSQDNTKHVFALIVTDRKKNFKGLYVHVLNENGEKEWERELLPKFPHKHFYLQDIGISSNGEIFMLLNSFDSEKRAKSEETIHFLRIFENEEEMYDIKSPYKDIYEMRMKYIEEKERVVIAGFYGQTDKSSATNLFTQTFNLSTMSFADFDKKNLSNLASTSKGKVFGAIGTKRFDYRCVGMDLLENGNVVLLGEQFSFYITTTTNNKGMITHKYNYDFRNIIVSFISSEGNILNTEKIEKSQFASLGRPIESQYYSAFGLSFDYFVGGTKVYTIFNDLTDNYTEKNKNRRLYNFTGKYKKTCTIIATIDLHNKADIHMINRYDNNPIYFHKLINHNPEKRTTLLLYGEKKAYSLHFLNY